MRPSLLLSMLLLMATPACSDPCERLAEKLCACAPAHERSRRACQIARDRARRRRAFRLARERGIEPRRICEEALASFHCPR